VAAKKNRALINSKDGCAAFIRRSGGAFRSGKTPTLAQRHRVLQMVMGWEDYHLHEVPDGRKIVGHALTWTTSAKSWM